MYSSIIEEGSLHFGSSHPTNALDLKVRLQLHIQTQIKQTNYGEHFRRKLHIMINRKNDCNYLF